MFEQDVAALRVLYEAFNRGDRVAGREGLDSEIVWETLADDPDFQIYRGRDEVEAHVDRIREVFGDYEIVPERFIDVGDDQILVTTRQRIRGTGSGAQIETRRYHLLAMREGRVARFRTFADEAAARRAAERDPGYPSST